MNAWHSTCGHRGHCTTFGVDLHFPTQLRVVYCCVCLASPLASRDFPVPTSHLAIGAFKLQAHVISVVYVGSGDSHSGPLHFTNWSIFPALNWILYFICLFESFLRLLIICKTRILNYLNDISTLQKYFDSVIKELLRTYRWLFVTLLCLYIFLMLLYCNFFICWNWNLLQFYMESLLF